MFGQSRRLMSVASSVANSLKASVRTARERYFLRISRTSERMRSLAGYGRRTDLSQSLVASRDMGGGDGEGGRCNAWERCRDEIGCVSSPAFAATIDHVIARLLGSSPDKRMQTMPLPESFCLVIRIRHPATTTIMSQRQGELNAER